MKLLKVNKYGNLEKWNTLTAHIYSNLSGGINPKGLDFLGNRTKVQTTKKQNEARIVDIPLASLYEGCF